MKFVAGFDFLEQLGDVCFLLFSFNLVDDQLVGQKQQRCVRNVLVTNLQAAAVSVEHHQSGVRRILCEREYTILKLSACRVIWTGEQNENRLVLRLVDDLLQELFLGVYLQSLHVTCEAFHWPNGMGKHPGLCGDGELTTLIELRQGSHIFGNMGKSLEH